MSAEEYYVRVSDSLWLYHTVERAYGGRKYAWYFEPGCGKWLFLAGRDYQTRKDEYLLNSTYAAPKVDSEIRVWDIVEVNHGSAFFAGKRGKVMARGGDRIDVYLSSEDRTVQLWVHQVTKVTDEK